MPELSRDVTNDQQFECSFGFADMDYEVYQQTSNSNIEAPMNCNQTSSSLTSSYNYHMQYNVTLENECDDAAAVLAYSNSQPVDEIVNDNKYSTNNHSNICLNSSSILDESSITDIVESRRGEMDFSNYILNNSQSDVTKGSSILPITTQNEDDADELFMMDSNQDRCSVIINDGCKEERNVIEIGGTSTRSSSSSSSRSGGDYLSLDMDTDLLLPSTNLFEFSTDLSEKQMSVQPEMDLDMLVSSTTIITKPWTDTPRRMEIHDYDYNQFDDEIDASLLISGMSPAFDVEANRSSISCGAKRTGQERSSHALNNSYRVRKMTTKAKHLNKGDTVLLKQPSFALGHEEVGTFGFMNFRRPGAWTRLKPGEADDDRRKRAMTKV